MTCAVLDSHRNSHDGARYVVCCNTASIVPPTMPQVCDGDHIRTSIMADCQVASHNAPRGQFACSDPDWTTGPNASRDLRNGSSLSVLIIPVMALQPDVS